ncbi:MAG: hypothetical protein QXE90_00780 [Candidatus Micrarchaeia archaeon]
MKEIYFKDIKKEKAPNIDNLISEIIDKRKNKKRNSENAIIILTYKSNNELLEFIKTLEKQNYRDFDLIIIYGPKDKTINSINAFNFVNIVRKEDIGCAGGFYLGEKYAYKEGYKRIIHIECDVRFVNKTTLKTIIESCKSKSIVMPSVFTLDFSIKGRGMHQATCFDSSLINYAGFTFLPLYFGAEDGEYEDRLKKYGKLIQIKDYVLHPTKSPILVSIYKDYYFLRNDLIRECKNGDYKRFTLYISSQIWVSFLLFLLNKQKFYSRTRAFLDFFKLKLGKIDEISIDQQEKLIDKIEIKNFKKKIDVYILKKNHNQMNIKIFNKFEKRKTKEYYIPISIGGLGSFKKLLISLINYFLHSFSIFNKNVMTNNINYFDYCWYLLLSKKIYLYENSTVYSKTIKMKDRIVSFLTYLFTPFALFIGSLLALYCFLFIYPEIKEIDGYGIE